MTLEVGPHKTIFRAHRDLLCSKSKFFEGCLGSGFSEALEKTVVLAEDSPKAVVAFLDWLYQHTVDVDVKQMHTGHLLSIYQFADKVCSEPYHNDLMDAIRKSCNVTNCYPGGIVTRLYDMGLMESQLMNLGLDLWAYEMVKVPQEWINGKLEEEMTAWSNRPKILPRLLRSVWEYQKSLPPQRPFSLTGCHYHTQAAGGKCTGLPAPTKINGSGGKEKKG